MGREIRYFQDRTFHPTNSHVPSSDWIGKYAIKPSSESNIFVVLVLFLTTVQFKLLITYIFHFVFIGALEKADIYMKCCQYKSKAQTGSDNDTVQLKGCVKITRIQYMKLFKNYP